MTNVLLGLIVVLLFLQLVLSAAHTGYARRLLDLLLSQRQLPKDQL